MYKIFNVGCNVTFIVNCKYTIAATLYTLKTWFCVRYIIVNTLYEGENNNNNIYYYNNNNCYYYTIQNKLFPNPVGFNTMTICERAQYTNL